VQNIFEGDYCLHIAAVHHQVELPAGVVEVFAAVELSADQMARLVRQQFMDVDASIADQTFGNSSSETP